MSTSATGGVRRRGSKTAAQPAYPRQARASRPTGSDRVARRCATLDEHGDLMRQRTKRDDDDVIAGALAAAYSRRRVDATA